MKESVLQAPRGGRVGPKTPVSGRTAVCSSQHALVTETMANVMKDGGNAVDAAIAGSLLQATVQQDMTNHAGTVTFLYWEQATRKIHDLNGMGTIVPGLSLFRPVPADKGLYASGGRVPYAVIPGFMPAMKALFERFASKPWKELCEPALYWAEEGHVVTSFEHFVLANTVTFFLHTPSGRAHFAPDGHLPQVGDRWPKPSLARTLARLADEGPDCFITGAWAQAFVERANELGWPIKLADMDASPPRWGSGLRYRHGDCEVAQLSPPQRQGVYCSLVLGVLDNLGIESLGHYTESAEALYFIAHALRRATHEIGVLNDPWIFEDPSEILMSGEYHALLARVLERAKPKVDLTEHVKLTANASALGPAALFPTQPTGSCELSIVDRDGNWVQMMNTLQSGGIPGEVVDGVPMVGSHGATSLTRWGGWLAGGGRMTSVIGNTIVLRNGRPWLALGTPGSVDFAVAQVLTNILAFRMDPYAAEDAPRMLPIRDDYTIPIESRIPTSVAAGLARLGVAIDPLPAYDYHMGSFQMSWRDERGLLHGCSGPRRPGTAQAW
jgi:gamma-glutamyltranspeptidase/glutathione hydrolase